MSFNVDNIFIRQGDHSYKIAAFIHTNDQIGLLQSNGKLTNQLENEFILSFEYANEINKLFIEGTLIYVDNKSIIDKYIEQQFNYLTVVIQEFKQKTTDKLAVTTDKPEHKLTQTFFIKNIQILDREGSKITYKLHFVSSNWLYLIGYAFYTNYNKKEPEEIFNIIKNILIENDLIIEPTTFDNIKSHVKTYYITSGNDNVITAVNYLLNRLFYYTNKDNNIKFIYYNEFTKKYNLYDLNSTSYDKKNSKSIVLSMSNNSSEMYVTPIQQNLASMISFPKTEVFKSQFQHNIFDYNYSKNIFIDNTINTDQIINFQRPTIIEKGFMDKYSVGNRPATKLKYQQTGSYWNNDINIYNNSINACLADSSIVINCEGQLLIIPSSIVQIIIDKNIEATDSVSKKEYEKLINRYKSFEGFYTVTKTRHIFSPTNNSYTQNLVLYRNYKKVLNI